MAKAKTTTLKSPPDYIQMARRRLEKVETGEFDMKRAYASYERSREKMASTRNLAKKLSPDAFEQMYKRVVTNVASAQIAGSAIKGVANIIAQAEVLTSRREAGAQAKATRKLAERYRKSGTPEEIELAEMLDKVTREDLLKMGEEALRTFTDKAIELGIKVQGVNFKGGSTNPKHVFWEVFYPEGSTKKRKK